MLTVDQLIDLEVRIDAGDYGACDRCGEEIAWVRLEAQPEAMRCGRCAG